MPSLANDEVIMLLLFILYFEKYLNNYATNE